ncbi:putative DD41D transposase [Trichonephila clavipes]|nr:putative DD41D transposase [Trichonephila clavipes]
MCWRHNFNRASLDITDKGTQSRCTRAYRPLKCSLRRTVVADIVLPKAAATIDVTKARSIPPLPERPNAGSLRSECSLKNFQVTLRTYIHFQAQLMQLKTILGKRVLKTSNLGALHFKYDQARRRFIEWAQNEIAVVPDFHKRILFSDEAHFWLNGYVNKQNCRVWSETNPQVLVESFKNDEGHNVTVNGDRYRAMITNFFIPELNNHDVQELWFQQDGATCHTARATIDLLKDTFGDRLISRFGPENWPPRSCD